MVCEAEFVAAPDNQQHGSTNVKTNKPVGIQAVSCNYWCVQIMVQVALIKDNPPTKKLGRVSPKLSQLGHQLTVHQLGYKLNSSFRFTNVRHVKSTRSADGRLECYACSHWLKKVW